MFEQMPNKNKHALISLFLAKIFNLIGICFGFVSEFRTLGGCLLGLSGALLILSIALCLFQMKSENKRDEQNKDYLKQMMQDGTLLANLRELGISYSINSLRSQKRSFKKI